MKSLVQVIITGVQVVGRAFGRALKAEVEASQQAAKARSGDSGGGGGGSTKEGKRRAAADALSGMSLSEAKQILNVDLETDKEDIVQKYEHLFQINEKAKGGSFYLQSKVYRAKERLDQEIQDVEEADLKKKQKADEQSPS